MIQTLLSKLLNIVENNKSIKEFYGVVATFYDNNIILGGLAVSNDYKIYFIKNSVDLNSDQKIKPIEVTYAELKEIINKSCKVTIQNIDDYLTECNINN